MDSNIISQKLINLRGDMSQSEVAKAVGISTSALSMYENGERIPRDYIKVKLAKFYNSTVGEIFFTDK